MPAALSYPGVYVEEIPSGVRTIVSVPTSVTAFVGRTSKGPVSEATDITSWQDFERKFGGLWQDSQLSFAVRDFYLNGGSRAVIVRLFNSAHSEEEITANKAAITAAKATIDDLKNKISSAGLDTGQKVRDAFHTTFGDKSDSPDKDTIWGKVNKAQNAFDAADKEATDNPDNKEKKDARNSAKAKLDAENTGLNAAIAMKAEIESLPNDTKDAQIISNKIKNAEAEASKTLPTALPTDRRELNLANLTFEAKTPGKWGGYLQLIATPVITKPDEDKVFNLTITNTSPGGASETFLNLSTKGGSPRRVDKVLENESNLLRWKGTWVPTTFPDFTNGIGDAKALGDEVGTAFLNLKEARKTHPNPKETTTEEDAYKDAKKKALESVSDGNDLQSTTFLPNPPDPENDNLGLSALEQLYQRDGIFNLLCIPPYKTDPAAEEYVDVGVIAAAAAYCEERRAMLIVDPPQGWKTIDNATLGFSSKTDDIGTRSPNAALFFPRIKQANPFRDNQIEEFAPCGVVAGIFARTDTERGVWKAPAGIEASLKGVNSLKTPMTDLENGLLNPLGINCLRHFPVYGKVVWGARTLQGADGFASEWKYIPVRRTALFIEESLYRGTKWVVFQPNDEPLWAQIRLAVGAFMHDLFRQGAFQGKSKNDAYYVKCNNETTTQSDINRGIVNIEVGFMPLKPAEFVVLRLQQMAGQIEV
ncbi:MAG: phage tail sheath C-terminal domain-containing protein [Methylococcales bacterium]